MRSDLDPSLAPSARPDPVRGRARRWRARAARWVAVLALLDLAPPPLTLAAYGADNEVATAAEQQLKAAFLYSFAKFVEWPDEAGRRSPGTFALCIWGGEQYEVAQQSLAGKSLRGQRLEVRPVHSAAGAKGCQLLFVSAASEPPPGTLETLPGPVLTVGESGDFIRGGGMINLVRMGNRLRFEIARDVGERAGLKFSSQLLKLATPVAAAR